VQAERELELGLPEKRQQKEKLGTAAKEGWQFSLVWTNGQARGCKGPVSLTVLSYGWVERFFSCWFPQGLNCNLAGSSKTTVDLIV